MGLTNIEQKIKGGEESICKTCAHNKVCRYMDNQPCIECSQYAEQERHGWWIYHNGRRTCPNCKDGRRTYVLDNYCPNCGAKMDKEAEHE